MPSFVEICPPVPEKFEGFLPYGHGDHFGQVTDHLCTHLLSRPIDASYKIWLILAKQFLRISLNTMVVYINIAPGWRHTNPWGPNRFRIINLHISPTAHFLQVLSFK